MLAMLVGVALQTPPAPRPVSRAEAPYYVLPGARPATPLEVIVLADPPAAAPQPAPAAGPKPPATPPPGPPAAPKAETLDEQIKRALSTHPDLRIAQLQIEFAQAKLEKERQRVTQRITTARAARDAAVQNRDFTEATVRVLKQRLAPDAAIGQAFALDEKLIQAHEKLAFAEVELLAATGGPPQPRTAISSIVWSRDIVRGAIVNEATVEPNAARFHFELLNSGAPTPAAPGDFRADLGRMLDERITPAKKDGSPRDLLTELLTKAAGGKPLPVVRLPVSMDEKIMKDPGRYALYGETDTLGAWLQQFQDAVNSRRLAQEPGTKYTLYVREYGLLLAPEAEAPAGAVTVAAFWERARAEKAAKDKPAPPAKK